MRGESIFSIIGAVCLAIGCIGWGRHMLFLQRAVKVPGKVTDFTTYVDHDEDGDTTMYKAIISYEYDGESYTIMGTVGTSWKPEIGRTCQVAVNPSDPQDARVYSRIPMPWGFLIGFGLTFLLVGMSGSL